MKHEVRVEIYLQSFLTSTLERSELSASRYYRRITREEGWCPLSMCLYGSQSRSGRCGGEVK